MVGMTLAARMTALADQLEADAVGFGGGKFEGWREAAELIRAEVAAEGPQTVWAVHATEYEDNGVRAILATPELAEQHRVQLGGPQQYSGYGIEEYDVLSVLPRRIQYQSLWVTVYPEGTVERHPGGGADSRWDYEVASGTHIDRPGERTVVNSYGENPEPALREQVASVISGYAADQGWSPGRLQWTLGREWVSRRPQVVERRCYEASFGMVHVRSSCRCAR